MIETIDQQIAYYLIEFQINFEIMLIYLLNFLKLFDVDVVVVFWNITNKHIAMQKIQKNIYFKQIFKEYFANFMHKKSFFFEVSNNLTIKIKLE